MKKLLFISILVFFLAPKSLSQGITAGSVTNLTVTGAVPGDSVTFPGYTTLTNLATKLSKADSVNKDPGYLTLTAAALKAPLASPTLTGTVVLPTTTLGGKVTPTDSTMGFIIRDSSGKKWLVRVMTGGTLHADSTGQN